eukprot:7386293-Prymnesium_polylepis.1
MTRGLLAVAERAGPLVRLDQQRQDPPAQTQLGDPVVPAREARAPKSHALRHSLVVGVGCKEDQRAEEAREGRWRPIAETAHPHNLLRVRLDAGEAWLGHRNDGSHRELLLELVRLRRHGLAEPCEGPLTSGRRRRLRR